MGRIVLIGAKAENWLKVKKSLEKPKKRKSRKKIKAELDKIFSIIIRNKGKCKRCGKTKPLNTAHIFSRRNLATRWDKDNVFCFCVGCHFWGHHNPILFVEFVKEKLGDEKYEKLKEKSYTIKKWTISELEELLEQFRKEVNNG